MVGVIAVVDVGDLYIRLEDGGFDRHSLARYTRRASSAALPI
jgi:hypothetical protein